MKQIKITIMVLALALLGAGIMFTRGKEGKEKEATTTVTQAKKDVYVCPMHLDVKSDKPGRCSKCNMTLVRQEYSESNSDATSDSMTAEQKVDKANDLLEQAEDELVAKGKINCCLNDPCSHCMMSHKSCGCGNSLKKGGTVCNECYAGWQSGDGAFKDIKASDVKTHYKKHEHKGEKEEKEEKEKK